MSFIRNFIKYNQGNECPYPYVLWTAYGLLAAAIGRRTFLDLKHFIVIPNIYILLIGPSGGRKTVARDKGVELLLNAIPDIVLAGDNETYQGIINFMHGDKSIRSYKDHNGDNIDYHPYNIFSPELMDYLQLNPQGMVTFLTNIYDKGSSPYIYRLKGEEHILTRPYVTMCSCSTPTWLTDQLKTKQFAEGYGRRTIIVCHEGIERKKPTLSPEEIHAGKLCEERLREIQNLAGPFVLTPDADHWFWVEWYPKQKDPSDSFIRNWYSSRHINLLKVAMLTVLSETNELVVTKNHLQLALALLDEIETKLPMITSRMGRSELTEPMHNILHYVRASKGFVREKDLRRDCNKDFKSTMELLSVLEHLIYTEQLKRIKQPANGVEVKFICLPECVIKEETTK